MKQVKIILITVLLIIGGGVIGYSLKHNSGELTQKPNSPIKIGVIGTMTGVGAYHGQQELRGVELARDEINASGGINGHTIELIVEDSKASPQEAVKIAHKLMGQDRVKLIVGDSWSNTTVAMVPLLDNYQALMISPIAVLDELSSDDLFFRTVPTINTMMSSLASYAYKEMGLRNIGVLRANTPFTIEHTDVFEQVFNRFGGEIIGIENFELTDADVGTQIDKIAALNPDGIFNLHASGAMLGNLMEQAIEKGVHTSWIASFGAETDSLVTEFADVAEGLTYPYPYDSQDNLESIQKFIKLYKETYNEQPDLTAANAYDALMLLAQAIEKVGEDPLKVKDDLLTIKDYEGASGILSFDENGDVKKPIIIKQIQDGEFVKVSN